MSTCTTAVQEHPPDVIAPPGRGFLDLLHPDGFARRVGRLGTDSRQAAGVVGDVEDLDRVHQYDAILLAPSTAECQTNGWLEDAVAAVGQLLAIDGVAYVMAPRRWRTKLLRLLAVQGLRDRAVHVHVRYGSSTEYVVRCDARALNHLVTSLPVRRSRERIVRAAVVTMPRAAGWLRLAATRSGVALRREGARSLFEWATGRHDTDKHLHAGVTRIKRRGVTAMAAVWLFRDTATSPCFILKTALTEAAVARIYAELHALERLGPAAAHAGAVVPSGTLISSDGRCVRYACLDGVPADAVLAAQPARLNDMVRRIASWLASWNASTRCVQIADASWLTNEVLEPARSVASVLDTPEPYLRWLARACERASGRSVPVVASHGDLTMSNILVDGGQPLGIVDWESARESGLPLADFYYAAADALAATERYRSRAQALVQSVDTDSDYGRLVASLATGVDSAFMRDQEMSRLLLHATALQHAADEQSKNRPALEPFAALVRWLAGRATRAGGHACR
jgi:Phosphotransferase enzyme family